MALCRIDSCSFQQVHHLTLIGRMQSAAKVRMLLRSFPYLHTLTMYNVHVDPLTDREDDQKTGREDDPKTSTDDDIASGGVVDIHQGKSHDAAVGIAARQIGYHCC